MWKAKVIMETIGKTNYSQNELNFVDSVINGGKTDNIERASVICAYMGIKEKESLVYNKLCFINNKSYNG